VQSVELILIVFAVDFQFCCT